MIESPVKSKLHTTNYLSSCKDNLYHKIDSDPSEISRTSFLARALCYACIIVDDVFNLAHAQIVHVVIVLLSLPCA